MHKCIFSSVTTRDYGEDILGSFLFDWEKYNLPAGRQVGKPGKVSLKDF